MKKIILQFSKKKYFVVYLTMAEKNHNQIILLLKLYIVTKTLANDTISEQECCFFLILVFLR